MAGALDLRDAESVPAELAHLYGLAGRSATQAQDEARRGLQTLADAWPEVLAQMIRRALQQAFLEALPAYWLRRAEQMQEIGTPWGWEAAAACRRHAWLLATQGLSQDLDAEIAEAVN